MADIKLYVSCHKAFFVPEHPLLYPIQVGAALTRERFDGWLCDDEGENISRKNRSYCELTAQYQVWKNGNADYLGFFHYRRYLYPDTNSKGLYILQREPSLCLLRRLGYDEFSALIQDYDILAPKAENMRISVREHYQQATNHWAEDFALLEEILREKEPDYVPAMEAYFSQSKCYFGNMYIMRQEIFQHYCAWLFPLLEEFDRRADWSGRSVQEQRVDGFLGERLFGVYLTRHRRELRVSELPRVHFEPADKLRCKQKIINFLLPPGSRRRAGVKKLGKRWMR